MRVERRYRLQCPNQTTDRVVPQTMTRLSVIVSECESTNGLVGSRLGVPEAHTLQSRNRLNSLRMVDNLFEPDRHMKNHMQITLVHICQRIYVLTYVHFDSGRGFSALYLHKPMSPPNSNTLPYPQPLSWKWFGLPIHPVHDFVFLIHRVISARGENPLPQVATGGLNHR